MGLTQWGLCDLKLSLSGSLYQKGHHGREGRWEVEQCLTVAQILVWVGDVQMDLQDLVTMQASIQGGLRGKFSPKQGFYLPNFRND